MFTQGNLNLRPFILWATNKYIDSRHMPVLCARGCFHSSWINPYMAKPCLFQGSIRSVCVYIHICSHVNIGVGGYTDADLYMFSCVCLCVHTCVNMGVGGYTHADMCAFMCVCVHACTFINMGVGDYTDTGEHVFMWRPEIHIRYLCQSVSTSFSGPGSLT